MRCSTRPATPATTSPASSISCADRGRLEVVNNRHAIQANVAPGGAIVSAGVEYELKQYRFHAPSEYALAGERTAVGVHFMHAAAMARRWSWACCLRRARSMPPLSPCSEVVNRNVYDAPVEVSQADIDAFTKFAG
jgi:carbonic anhydrase